MIFLPFLPHPFLLLHFLRPDPFQGFPLMLLAKDFKLFGAFFKKRYIDVSLRYIISMFRYKYRMKSNIDVFLSMSPVQRQKEITLVRYSIVHRYLDVKCLMNRASKVFVRCSHFQRQKEISFNSIQRITSMFRCKVSNESKIEVFLSRRDQFQFDIAKHINVQK